MSNSSHTTLPDGRVFYTLHHNNTKQAKIIFSFDNNGIELLACRKFNDRGGIKEVDHFWTREETQTSQHIKLREFYVGGMLQKEVFYDRSGKAVDTLDLIK